jgi:hypothetical protein
LIFVEERRGEGGERMHHVRFIKRSAPALASAYTHGGRAWLPARGREAAGEPHLQIRQVRLSLHLDICSDWLCEFGFDL